MTGNDLQFKVDISDLANHAIFKKDWPKETIEKIGMRLEELFIAETAQMQKEIVPEIPRGVTGHLRASYKAFTRRNGLETYGEFGSASLIAKYIEEGTRPHWIPRGALVMWLMRKVGIQMLHETAIEKEYVFRRAIARRGTRPNPIVGPWFDKNQARLFVAVMKGLDLIFEEIQAKA